MADKKPEATLERIYTIPLRKTWVKTRRIARAKKCIRVIKEYVTRHAKAKEISISQNVSKEIWSSGPKKPPAKITVKVSVSAGKANVRLPGEITLEEEKKKFLEAKKKGTEKKDGGMDIKEGKAQDAAAAGPAEAPAEEAKPEDAAPAAEEKAEGKEAAEDTEEKEKPKAAAPKKEKKTKTEKK